MPKASILYVITKLELGGAQKHLLDLIIGLDKERFKPFLFACPNGPLLPDALAIKGLTFKKSCFLERRINLFKDFLAFIEICRYIKKNNIEVVHTHSSKAGILGRWAARFCGVRFVVHTVHGWSFNDCQPGLIRWFYIWLERASAAITVKLIVVSDHDREKGLALGIGSKDKYELIRYGIDYSAYRPEGEDLRRSLEVKPDELLVGTVSCLKPQKCPRDFVKLCLLVNNVLPGVKFILVGDGPERCGIEKLIASSGLKGQFILAGWRRDIPEFLRSLDIFALTSLWEGLPISILEAIKTGKPVVATNTGGIAEVIVEGKTGYLSEPRDVAAMAEKLIILLKNRDLRIRLGSAARDSLGQDFNLPNMLEFTQNLYSRLLASKH